MKPTKKLIKILHVGPIYEKGGVCGPISSPYMEDMSVISRLIFSNKKVVEVLKDGKEIPLTIKNFDKDNSEEAQQVKPVTPPVEKKVHVEQSPIIPKQKNYEKNNKHQNRPPFQDNKSSFQKQEEKKSDEPKADVLESV